MIDGITLFLLTVAGFLAAVVLTPLARLLATHCGLVDRPDAVRKIHGRSIALGGGVAVLFSTALVVGLALLLPSVSQHLTESEWSFLKGLGPAAAVLCVVGLFDDFKGLRARQKLLGQIIASLTLMCSGFVIHSVQLFGSNIDLGLLSWPFTLFWLLGAINSVNLIDGADGLATTVGIVLSGTIAWMALIGSNDFSAVIALGLMGSLVGFLCYNFPPATIFLGDAGSMLIGLLAGALAIHTCLKGPATIAMAAPVAIWAVPAFDCAIAIARRKLTGRSVCTVDRGHLHHCLIRSGYSGRSLLFGVALLCGITASGALLSMKFGSEWMAFASVALVVGVLVVTRVFGHGEFLLATTQARQLVESLLTPPWRARGGVQKSTVRLQGSREWEHLWAALIESVDSLGLVRVRLTLNLPWLHENYHASWNRDSATKVEERWHIEIPLNVEGRIVGLLLVAGTTAEGAVGARLSQLGALVESVEDQLEHLIRESKVAMSAEPASAAAAALAGSDVSFGPELSRIDLPS